MRILRYFFQVIVDIMMELMPVTNDLRGKRRRNIFCDKLSHYFLLFDFLSFVADPFLIFSFASATTSGLYSLHCISPFTGLFAVFTSIARCLLNSLFVFC